ncbi:RNA polymerase sigma factor [Botrimarina hoheduenensis]|uniref:RNA polymerase sigma factor n=1 Tax=Botrimarina hoheduenensis TaxID=2528000 RepID=A0A5C5WEC5_9BACT|nr:RNA polymerase sigma factor [Botrimarina hoheduenensis]
MDPERWLDEYGDSLMAYAVVRVRDTATAEDLVQETLLAAWRGRAAYAGQAAERSWLVGILKRKIADYWRATRGRRHNKVAGNVPHENDPPLFNSRSEWAVRPQAWSLENAIDRSLAAAGAAAEAEEFWQVLARCQADLPQHLVRVFHGRTITEASPEQLCEEEGISRQNLSVRLHRARLLVRRCLERRWFCEED